MTVSRSPRLPRAFESLDPRPPESFDTVRQFWDWWSGLPWSLQGAGNLYQVSGGAPADEHALRLAFDLPEDRLGTPGGHTSDVASDMETLGLELSVGSVFEAYYRHKGQVARDAAKVRLSRREYGTPQAPTRFAEGQSPFYWSRLLGQARTLNVDPGFTEADIRAAFGLDELPTVPESAVFAPGARTLTEPLDQAELAEVLRAALSSLVLPPSEGDQIVSSYPGLGLDETLVKVLSGEGAMDSGFVRLSLGARINARFADLELYFGKSEYLGAFGPGRSLDDARDAFLDWLASAAGSVGIEVGDEFGGSDRGSRAESVARWDRLYGEGAELRARRAA